MRATISIGALPTLAPRISSNRFKEMQFSHSETVVGCTILPRWTRLLACAACWVRQGVGNYQLKRASISIEALPTLLWPRGSRQLASESVKVTQLSHSETVAQQHQQLIYV
jgi:hypothetical protein